MKRGIIIIAAIFALNSCKKENRCDCFKSTGKIFKEERNITSFNDIVLNDNVNLFIKQGVANSCIVEAGENLIPEIETNVNNNVLRISNDNRCNWVRRFDKPVNVYLTVQDLQYIECRGSGNVICSDTLKGDSLRIDSWDATGSIDFVINIKTTQIKIHTGPCDIKMRGISGVSYLYFCGNGKADLSEMKSSYVFITSKSTNDVYINVSKELDVWIDYIGNIYYKGSPYIITTKYTDKGRLIHY